MKKKQTLNRWKLNRFKRIHSWCYSRCNYPKNDMYKMYGALGIKCLVSWRDVMRVWFRDVAWMMKKPCLDRIDPDGHYTIDNIRFLPEKDNLARRRFKSKERVPGEEG